MEQQAVKSADRTGAARLVESLRRWILAFIGILCVAIGALGVILPGLPTTIFLLAACYLFTRSCPALERVLVRNRFFAAFHRYLDGSVEMPMRAKVITLIIMWSFISVSTFTLWNNDNLSKLIPVAVPLAGLIGTYFILRYGRPQKTQPSANSRNDS